MSKCNNRVAFEENISYNSFISKVLDNLNKIRGSKAPAFTLTEVLLAVLIVGIIAALVLPAVVTKYQDKTFESAFNREVHSLQDSIDSLAAVENQQSFYETTLAKTPETYMKKYLRVSKYCGASGKDCFGKFYSEYSDHEKKTYTPSYDGNCAILKNGTSVCLNVNGGSIDMLIDVNGPKGPNVWGRDLRTYTHSVKGITGYDMTSNGIISLNQTPIEDKDSDPCEGKTCGCGDLPDCDPCAGKTCGCGSLPACEPVCTSTDTSLACCKKRTITGESDACCKWSYYDNDKTCHPCPVAGSLNFSGIGCVYVLPSFSPVLHGTSDMYTWDYNLDYWNKTIHRSMDSYWAGARKSCAALGMSLPDIDKLRIIAKYSNSHSNPIPSGWYWSSADKNDHGDVIQSVIVLFTSGNSAFAGLTGDKVKDESGVKAVCIGN